jgi:hypothetical protein
VVAHFSSVAVGSPAGGAGRLVAIAALILVVTPTGAMAPGPSHAVAVVGDRIVGDSNNSAVANFTDSINRLVDLVALAGSGILALVWARVALSWFSNDITKKVQAKDRARDALIGTLLFTAAITGLFWGLAHWVLTGA